MTGSVGAEERWQNERETDLNLILLSSSSRTEFSNTLGVGVSNKILSFEPLLAKIGEPREAGTLCAMQEKCGDEVFGGN